MGMHDEDGVANVKRQQYLYLWRYDMIPGKKPEPLLGGANANEQEPGGVLHGLFLDQSSLPALQALLESQAVVLVQQS